MRSNAALTRGWTSVSCSSFSAPYASMGGEHQEKRAFLGLGLCQSGCVVFFPKQVLRLCRVRLITAARTRHNGFLVDEVVGLLALLDCLATANEGQKPRRESRYKEVAHIPVSR